MSSSKENKLKDTIRITIYYIIAFCIIILGCNIYHIKEYPKCKRKLYSISCGEQKCVKKAKAHKEGDKGSYSKGMFLIPLFL